MPYYYGFDMTYVVFVLPALIFTLIAQGMVQSTFRKYARVPSDRGMTGADAARLVLEQNGVTGVRIASTSGSLTDHYDPRDNTIYLSQTVFDVQSAAAVGVAAHEAGHAVQHAVGYFPIRIRSAIIPITNIGSSLAVPLVIAGLIFSYYPLAYLGVICFGACVVFQLVTLPVEFNASHRALVAIDEGGLLTEEEQKGARKTLTAAALTYVAATATALAQLLRLLVIFGGNGRRRRD